MHRQISEVDGENLMSDSGDVSTVVSAVNKWVSGLYES